MKKLFQASTSFLFALFVAFSFQQTTLATDINNMSTEEVISAIQADAEAWEAELNSPVVLDLESESATQSITSRLITVTLNNPNASISLTADCYEMYLNTDDTTYHKLNSKHLQNVINAVSAVGGGTITLPSGQYYFYPMYKNFDNENSVLTSADINYVEYHVINCRDNVTINGTLDANGNLTTTLSPVAYLPYPVDMFYHANLIDAVEDKYDTSMPTYIENMDFNDFIVDYTYTENYGYYNAKGKAFFMVLLKDCDWNNVTVKYTDGTGFGVDCPINCTMTNCTAIGCGKSATSNSVGASGFGIGFGYNNAESMLITNCTAIGNRKFGIFFEDQARFEKYYQAETSNGFVVKNCSSRGNLYNYGGEMCSTLTFIDCVSEKSNASDPNPLNVTNKAAYYFGTNSTDFHIIQNDVEINQYLANKDYYTDVYAWFVDDGWFEKILASGIMYGYTNANGELTFVFGQEDYVSRGQLAVMLYRYCYPGKSLNMSATNQTPFKDNISRTFYTEAMNWAYAEGIFTGYKTANGNLTGYIRPEGNITREELATVLYRFAKSEGTTATYNTSSYLSAPDAKKVSSWASDAIAWCYANKVMSGNGLTKTIEPTGNATRAQAAKMILQTINTL